MIQETKKLSLGIIDDLVKPRNLFLVYGSISRPKQYFPDLDYDIIVVPCFLNREWGPDLSFNHVLTSVHKDIERVDSKSADDFISNIAIQMTEESKQKGYVYLYHILEESIFYRKTKINLLAAIPLFKSSEWFAANPDQKTLKSYRKALKKQVQEGVERISTRIPDGQNLYSIAFPAMAASSGRYDSYNTLSYEETFSAILNGIEQSRFPDTITSIYIVIYNELHHIEFKNALNGFWHSYHRFVMERKVNFVLAFVIFALYLGIFSKLKKQANQNWLMHIIILAVGVIIFVLPFLLGIRLTFIMKVLMHLNIPMQIVVELLLAWVFYQLGSYWFKIKTTIESQPKGF